MSYTILRCPCGKKIGVRPSNTDAKHQKYINGMLHRFNVADVQALALVYRCRTCRNIKVKTSKPIPTIQLVQPSAVKKLKLIGTGVQIDMGKYENFFVGFEFEFAPNGPTRTNDIIAKYNIERIGKTLGKGKTIKQIRLADGGTLNVPIDDDYYKSPRVVTQIYQDPSVGYEVVTRPLHFRNLNLAKDVFEHIKTQGTMKTKKAGLHMTFLLDQHMELSHFDDLVVRNLIQMIRMNYKEIIHMFRQSQRGTGYRILNDYRTMSNPASTMHHCAVSCRAQGGRIWAVEIRLPDGTDDWELVKKQVLFYSALIRHCAQVSKRGLIYIEQETMNKQKQFFEQNTGGIAGEDNSQEVHNIQIDLLNRLANDIEALSQKEVNIADMYEVVEADSNLRREVV